MKRHKRYILYMILILGIFFAVSCGISQNSDETVISKGSLESDTENEQIKDILYEIEKLKSENSDVMSELDILREELENIKDEYSILDNAYSEKVSELESEKSENDLLKSENEQLKSEIDIYEKDKKDEKNEVTESVQEVVPAPDIRSDVQVTDEVKAPTEDIPDISSQVKNTILYVLNKSTKKFHISTCGSASSIKAENYAETHDRSYAVNNGYDACKKCNP